MNEMKLLYAFGGISDEYILEACGIQRRKINKRVVVLLIAAAVVLCMVSAGRFGLIDTLQRYFMGDLSPYAEQISETIKQVQNDDITMTVHGFFFESEDCQVVISLESHSKKGQKIVGDLSYLTGRYNEDNVKLGNKLDEDASEEECKKALRKLWKKHGLETDEPSVVFSNGERTSNKRARLERGEELLLDTNYLSVAFDGNMYNNKYRFENVAHINMKYYDYDQPLVITETVTGLSIELNLSDYIERRPLKAVNGAGFEDVTISPYTLEVHVTDHDLESGRYLKDGGYYGEDAYSEVTISFKDGSTISPFAEVSSAREFPDFNGAPEAKDKFFEEQYKDNTTITEQSLVARVEDDDGYFELDDIESVIIDGVEYRYAE